MKSKTRTGQKRNFQNADTPRLDSAATFRKSRPKSFTNRISVYQPSTVHTWNWQSSSLEPYRPHQERPAGCDIAQQYTSASFVSSLRFHSLPQENIWRAFQEVYCFFLFYFLKTEWVCNCLIPGVLEFLKSTIQNWSFVVTVFMVRRI
jgi:hypothetical protein